ncbi:uncharacterized protein MEPE_01666 [Melanopsichium pennsylvanicum]|uniref:Uncharacterized protein n=2 Tax=Melanopsichium pennsylvanicum TaxID=63383 RepID=A0AAJ4XIV1_9BASI|nr:putative protein [Melanopsichium pennsylvanicum 4]SNX82960.1 uncharacterized protein MEPE_01666 [Melanopsichium pennsylvanicum]
MAPAIKVQLPDEIVDHILYLACSLPPLRTDDFREPSEFDVNRLKARSSAPHLDVRTTLKLLLLSPQHYPYITSILYKGPRLSDPISLSLFARTLTNRPALGRLVKHLWVGHTYQGEGIPPNALAFGLGGSQTAYSLNSDLATIDDVRQCLSLGIAPHNLLSPAFEKRIAQWAAQNVQANIRTVDPMRAPRGIHIDSPGSGDRDARGWNSIGVDEWVLRLWDGRDLVKQFREVAKRAFFLELKRLSLSASSSTSSSAPSSSNASSRSASPATRSGSAAARGHSTSSLLNTDMVTPFSAQGPEQRIPGTEQDPLDWADATRAPSPNLSRTTDMDEPIYSEELDLDEIDAERDRCFAEMGVKKPAWRSQNWSEIAKVGDQKVEWWVVWLLAKTRARARIVARRIWQADFQRDSKLRTLRALRPRPELHTKNHFTHPTLFARSGASHLLVGGAPPPIRDEIFSGRHGDVDGTSDSDSDTESEAASYSEGSDYDSEMEASTTRMDMSIVREPHPSQRQPGTRRAAGGSSNFVLPDFIEPEQQKPEDPADLWGGDYNFANGNERAGAGNSILGSRGGMFGFDSALRTGLLDEPDAGLDDGTEFATLQKEKQRRRNEEDRLLSETTLGSILQSLRTVMMLTPRLNHLALDGVLERSICGRRAMCTMGKLKSLSLGPPPPYWSSPLLFGHPMKTTRRQRLSYHQKTHGASSPDFIADDARSQSLWPLPGVLIPSPAFSTLRTLHISGCMLFPSEARAVGGLGGQLPSLRHFRWSLWQPHVDGHPVGVVETLCAILDIPTPEEEATAAAATARAAIQSSSSGFSFGTSTSSSGTYREMENGKRRRRHGDSRRRSNPFSASGSAMTDSALSSSLGSNVTAAGASHEASLYALVTRKRKLRSVYVTLHPTDQAIFARKAPAALRYDTRLTIETAKCKNVEDNLEEMQRWWEWESGMLHFKPTVSNLDAITKTARRKQMDGPPSSLSAQELNADHSGIQMDLRRAMDTELELEPRT